LIKMMRIVKK